MGQHHSVLITDDNADLWDLERSWQTVEFSGEDGIGPMATLHQAGDAVAGVARLTDEGVQLIGSGVMIGPGLLLTASHVMAEFTRDGAGPVFLTFLPDGARAWLPKEAVRKSGRSDFAEGRTKTSDVTLVGCTLNSDAHSAYPLTLAPMQIALPLLGERLWAFGFRQAELKDETAGVTPLVSSGVVSAAFPQGRGERMPAACIEVAMDTWGGMSGGPVVNSDGRVVGIVSSSFQGGPSYVTLIWDILTLSVRSTHPSFAWRGNMNLFGARDLGFVKLKGNVKRFRLGKVVISLTGPEIQLLAESSDPTAITGSGTVLDDDQLQAFHDKHADEMEEMVGAAAIEHLRNLSLSGVREFLAAEEIAAELLSSIHSFTATDLEGVEDFEVLSNVKGSGNTIELLCGFDLLTVKFLIRYSAGPMQLFGNLGLISLAAGSLAGAATLGMKLFGGIDMTGNPLLLLSVLGAVVGVQFLVLGLLGEVCSRIYFACQDRQPYAVRRLVNFDDDGAPATLVKRAA